jgi:hypothetical protein
VPRFPYRHCLFWNFGHILKDSGLWITAHCGAVLTACCTWWSAAPLHLAAATAAAACYDRATTEAVLAKARGVADCIAEANHMGTAFGPVNVAIHAISTSLRLGDPRTATEIGEALDIAAMPVGLVGRRTQVNLDLARAYAMCRKDAAAVNLLLAAERLSPQLFRCDQATRDVLTELLRREHRPSTPELRPLAHRAGVI